MFLTKNTRFFAASLVCAVLFSACRTQKQPVITEAPVVEQPAPIVTLSPTPVAPVEPPAPVVEVENNARPNVCSIEKSQRGTWAGEIQYTLDSLSNSDIFQTTQMGMYVYDITADCPLYAVNASQRLRPASNQKLVTSISALHFLGGEYLFSTTLKILGTVTDGTLNGNVYVVGGMDPLLDKSNLNEMAAALKNEGISNVSGNLYMDLSMRESEPLGWGWCWDDDYGPLSALTVDGKNTFPEQWISSLTAAGITLKNATCDTQNAPAQTKVIKTVSHTMDQVLIPMMKNSENIYAESMFYNLAAHSGQKGAGHKQAATYVNQLLTKLGLNAKNYQVADGSGLSLYDYVSPLMLVTLLRHAYATEEIRTHLYNSLPIAGEDGTLSKRMKGTAAQGNVFAKTGTVDGVSTLSGYAFAKNNHILAFSIMNQGIIQSSVGKDFQDKVCVVLCQ